MTQDDIRTGTAADYVATRRQVLIGEHNGSAEIIAALPDITEGRPQFYVVCAVTYGRADQPPQEYVTWCVRTDQPGYYWGRYFLVNDGDDPKKVRATALADMARRAGYGPAQIEQGDFDQLASQAAGEGAPARVCNAISDAADCV